MGRLILLFLLVVAAVLLVNWLLKEDPKKVARYLRRGALWFAVIAIVLLAATGRLNWIFALFAAALPFIGRLMTALRYVPILSQLYSHYQNRQAAQGAGGAQSGPKGGASRVSSRFLHMTLDHESGGIDGEILSGQFAGSRLSDLEIDQLRQLVSTYRQQDEESLALLQAYLDRTFGDSWREPGYTEADDAAGGGGPMTAQEARDILGVADDATEEDVVAAHRRLMQKMHPDRGGSTYLAAKINQAKDLLLETDRA